MSPPTLSSNAATRQHQVFGLYRSTALAALLLGAAGLAQAGFVPFNATVEGVSQILEVIDPSGPVVRVETLALGTGSPGTLRYRSGDILNLGNGQGSGTNSFTTASGDELFGSFTVQLVPGADPSLFDLVGDVVFTGGTGDFLGASGFASFTAKGRFVSAVEATTRFDFAGRVATVPEPSSALLGLLGLLGLAIGSAPVRRRHLAGGHWRRPPPKA